MQRKGSRTGAAKTMAIEDISYQISVGDMDAAEELADKWSDLHTSKRIQNELDPNLSEDHNSFDAVGIIKRKTDTKDPFYIYIINNGNLNNGSDYIFKASKQITRIALAMDLDGPENVLQLENAYFDATNTRIYGFKSLGLWMFHPSQRKILRLACMEICTENANDIAKFFTLYNEILQKETGQEGYRFNPRYFMCDEGSANYCTIRQIYGENFTNARVVGCQWHFKNDVNRHSKDVSPDMRGLFNSLCHKLCACTTIAKYKIIKSRLDDIGNMNPGIKRWIQWCDDRRSHIFTPYRGGGLPGVNLSEQGNAGWVTRQMRLVHAAKYDVATMMTQEKQVFKFDHNLEKSTGRRPTQAARVSRDRSEQVTVGEEFVEILSDEEAIKEEARQGWEPAGFIPKKKCKHRPKKVKLVQDESTPKNSTTKTVRTKEKSSTKCKVSEETNEQMPNGEIRDDQINERKKYLRNDVMKINKNIQEVTNIIEGKKTNRQVAQAVQTGYVTNPEIERYRVPNPPL